MIKDSVSTDRILYHQKSRDEKFFTKIAPITAIPTQVKSSVSTDRTF